jgi:hypothetical protein
MALTKRHVLDTLSDPNLLQIDFWVGGVLHVDSYGFEWVREMIYEDDIKVVEGTNKDNAYYNSRKNRLTTQNVSPPPDLGARALLVHECVHAIVDVRGFKVTTLSNEVAAYLAQFTYHRLGDPNVTVGAGAGPWQKFFQNVDALVKKFKLHTPQGRGARLQWKDFSALRTELNHLNIYQNVKDDDQSDSDGVKVPVRIKSAPEEVTTSYQNVEYERLPPVSDRYLIELLAPRYAEDDVAGYGGRVRKLEKVFQTTDPSQAKTLIPRLQARMRGDKVSTLFHDHLSTKTRDNLVGILRSR